MTIAVLPSGPFTADALPAIGLTSHGLRQACDRNEIRRILRGVYVASSVPDSIGLRAAALRLVVSDHQVVVDRTAAWFHGIDTYAVGELDAGPPVEVCSLRGRTRSRLAGVRGRTRDLAPDDVMELAGLRVTTPLRTALDLGCHLRRRESFAALCDLTRRHDLDRADLLAGADRFARRRGVLQLRELIPLIEPLVESPARRGPSSRSATPACRCRRRSSGSRSMADRRSASISAIAHAGSASSTTGSTSTS